MVKVKVKQHAVNPPQLAKQNWKRLCFRGAAVGLMFGFALSQSNHFNGFELTIINQ